MRSVGHHSALGYEPAPADPERIRRENEHPGTRDWMATNVRVDPKTKYRCPWIEGYASRTSVRPGESITIHVSTNPPSPFLIEIYRMGYYQGHGGRLVMKIGPIEGSVQPDPPVGPKRLRECAWEPVHDDHDPGRLDQRRLPGKAHRRARAAPELRRLRRPRRPQGRLPLPGLRHDLERLQPLAQPVLALRRRQERVVLGPERPDELRPALRQVLPDRRCPAVGRLGRVPALGVPAGLLDGAARLRRHATSRTSTPTPTRPACAGPRAGCRSATTSTGRCRCSRR